MMRLKQRGEPSQKILGAYWVNRVPGKNAAEKHQVPWYTKYPRIPSTLEYQVP